MTPNLIQPKYGEKDTAIVEAILKYLSLRVSAKHRRTHLRIRGSWKKRPPAFTKRVEDVLREGTPGFDPGIQLQPFVAVDCEPSGLKPKGTSNLVCVEQYGHVIPQKRLQTVVDSLVRHRWLCSALLGWETILLSCPQLHQEPDTSVGWTK